MTTGIHRCIVFIYTKSLESQSLQIRWMKNVCSPLIQTGHNQSHPAKIDHYHEKWHDPHLGGRTEVKDDWSTLGHGPVDATVRHRGHEPYQLNPPRSMVFASLIYNSGRCIGCGMYGLEILYTVKYLWRARNTDEPYLQRVRKRKRQERGRNCMKNKGIVSMRDHCGPSNFCSSQIEYFNAHFHCCLLSDLAHTLNIFSR